MLILTRRKLVTGAAALAGMTALSRPAEAAWGTASHHGHNTNTGGTTATISITADAGDYVVVGAFVPNTSSTLPTATIAGASLTWTSLGASSGLMHASEGCLVQLWGAPAASSVTAQTVTVTSSLTLDSAATVYASFPSVNATPIDVNGSIPVQTNHTGAGNMDGVMSTTATDTLAVCLGGTNLNTPTLPWTVYASGTFVDSVLNAAGTWWGNLGLGTMLFTAAQTNTTVGFSNSATQDAFVATALVKGAAAPSGRSRLIQ